MPKTFYITTAIDYTNSPPLWRSVLGEYFHRLLLRRAVHRRDFQSRSFSCAHFVSPSFRSGEITGTVSAHHGGMTFRMAPPIFRLVSPSITAVTPCSSPSRSAIQYRPNPP